MSDRLFASGLSQLTVAAPLQPYSKVILWLDDENSFTAGDDTGRTLEADLSWATQAIADKMLSQIKGYIYKPFEGTRARIDPAAELGDAVTVCGVYGQLASMEIICDAMSAVNIAAPAGDELDDEYPYEPKQERETRRQFAGTRSLITKTAEQIRLEVYSEIDDLSASVELSLDSISAEVRGLDNSVSALDLYVGGLTLSVTDNGTSSTIKLLSGSAEIASQNITMSGMVTYTGLENGTTVINGACIKTGIIDAERLNLTGAITWSDLSSSVQDDINDAYTMAEDAQTVANDVDDVVSGWTYRGTTYIDGEMLMTGTVKASSLQGGTVDILDASGSSVASMYIEKTSTVGLTIDSDYSLRLLSADNLYLEGENASLLMSGSGISVNCGWFVPSGTASYLGYPNRGMWQAVYAYTDTIQTSDRNKKHDIESLPDKYLDMLLDLSVYRFKMNTGTSDRYHVGYVAQDVEEYMNKHDIDSLEFGGFVKDADEDGNDIYMLRYGEFMAIHTMAIQKIYQRLEAAGL